MPAQSTQIRPASKKTMLSDDYREAYGVALRTLGLNQSEVNRQKPLVTDTEDLPAYDLAERHFNKIILERNARRDAKYARTLNKIFRNALIIVPPTFIASAAAAFVLLPKLH